MDHTDNTLRGIVKALTDVIAPALDPTDALAAEQLRLSVDYLNFLRSRLDLLHGREMFDFDHHLEMARSLGNLLPPEPSALANGLWAAIGEAEALKGDARAGTATLKAATAALAAAIRTAVRDAASLEETTRRCIEAAVLDRTDERIAFERSWYLPLGLDPAPAEVETVTALLERGSAARTDKAPLGPMPNGSPPGLA